MERPTKETSKYYVSHAKDADLNKAMNDASMGMIKLLETEKKIAPARCLWTCQRGDGLPGRRDLRYREERPLPDSEEHLGRQTLTRRIMEGRPSVLFRVSMACVSSLPSGSPWRRPELAQERIQVVTTTTDLRSLTEAVGGEQIAAVSLVPANMDAEEYQPKPQDMLRLKNARLLVRVGLDYDLWLDRLLVQTGHPDISRGGPGYVDASFGIAVLEVRGMSVGPGDGHAHGSGNPHYWLDPRNAEIITATILEGWRGSTRPMRQITRPTGRLSSRAWRPNWRNGRLARAV